MKLMSSKRWRRTAVAEDQGASERRVKVTASGAQSPDHGMDFILSAVVKKEHLFLKSLLPFTLSRPCP